MFSSVTSQHVTNVALLVPEDPRWLFSAPRVLPAIDRACDEIKRRQLLTSTTLRVRTADSSCHIGVAMHHAIDLFMNGTTNLFLGPCCDYAVAPVARQAVFWNVPIVTPGAMSADFTRKKLSEYRLLTRISADFNSLATALASVLDHYDWHKVKIVYQYDGFSRIATKFCHLAADSLHRFLMARGNITQDYFKMMGDGDRLLLGRMHEEIGVRFAGQSHVHSALVQTI